MKSNYNLSHRLIVYVLFIGILLQSCGGFQNQVVPQGKKEPSKNLELSDKPLINTDKAILTSGGYSASFYEEKGELKADLRADESQPKPNYEGVPVLIEEGTNLASLSKLDPTTQKSRVELNRAHNGQLRHITIRQGGLLGGMMKGDEDQEKEKEKEKEKESKKRKRTEKEKTKSNRGGKKAASAKKSKTSKRKPGKRKNITI